ncbi:hypothetical protein DOY81_004354, partial [Sarcophaga bullata]
SRSINKAQNEIMLNKMQKNKTIARGFVKIPREVLSEFWNALTEELNSAGPPNKNVSEWKKVWIDQKRYIRSKAVANIRNRRQSKGLTENEQRILELVGIKESVEGLENTFKLGLSENFSDNEIKRVTTPPVDLEEPEDLPCSSKHVTPPPLDKSKKETSENKPVQKISTENLIAKEAETEESFCTPKKGNHITQEIETEENVCSQITQLCDSVKSDSKELEIGIKRIYRALEKSNELRAKKLKLQEQHNALIEQLRIKEVESKIEKNKKLIEIEEMKLKMLIFFRK